MESSWGVVCSALWVKVVIKLMLWCELNSSRLNMDLSRFGVRRGDALRGSRTNKSRIQLYSRVCEKLIVTSISPSHPLVCHPRLSISLAELGKSHPLDDAQRTHILHPYAGGQTPWTPHAPQKLRCYGGWFNCASGNLEHLFLFLFKCKIQHSQCCRWGWL